MARGDNGRRFDYLLDAVDFGDELTPAQNRRRINALRAGTVKTARSKAKLPGQAANAGISQRMAKQHRSLLKQALGRGRS